MAEDPYEGTDIGGGRRSFKKPDYAANSRKAKDAKPEEEEKGPRVERVVKEEAVQRKKPLARRIAENFTGEDIHSVGDWIIFEVIIPATKNLITDVVKEGIERIMFPGGSTHPSTYRTGASRTAYGSSSRLVTPSQPPQMNPRARATHDFQDLRLNDRVDAEAALSGLSDCIEEFGWATVKDLYDLVGITSSFIDSGWGWTDIRGASVRRLPRGGFLLDLPRPIPLD